VVWNYWFQLKEEAVFSEIYCVVLLALMTMEEVLLNAADNKKWWVKSLIYFVECRIK
jgi:hypothetical protein